MGNKKLEKVIPKAWEQARKNVEEDKKNKYAHLKEKLDYISKDVEVLKGVNGMIELDPNNWNHVYWWEEDERIEEFMDENRDKIEQYAKLENVSIQDAVDILFEQNAIKQALMEVKLIKEGKLKAKTWDELKKELKNEKEDEE